MARDRGDAMAASTRVTGDGSRCDTLWPALARVRAYHPTLGNWATRDPIGYTDGPNLSQYVGSDPTTFTDPLGSIKIGWIGGGPSTSVKGEGRDLQFSFYGGIGIDRDPDADGTGGLLSRAKANFQAWSASGEEFSGESDRVYWDPGYDTVGDPGRRPKIGGLVKSGVDGFRPLENGDWVEGVATFDGYSQYLAQMDTTVPQGKWKRMGSGCSMGRARFEWSVLPWCEQRPDADWDIYLDLGGIGGGDAQHKWNAPATSYAYLDSYRPNVVVVFEIRWDFMDGRADPGDIEITVSSSQEIGSMATRAGRSEPDKTVWGPAARWQRDYPTRYEPLAAAPAPNMRPTTQVAVP